MADAETFKFRVEWFDDRACMTKEFVLNYFIRGEGFPNEVSLFDIKTKRLFLKRVACTNVQPEDLYIGSRVTIYSRQLKIVNYHDAYTRQLLGDNKKTFVVQINSYRDFGSILSSVHRNGFKLTKMKSVLDPQSRQLSLCIELVGNSHSPTADPWDQVFKGASNPAFREANVFEHSPETDRMFGDASSTAVFDNCSLLLIKPHSVRAGQTGDILSSLLESRFEISAIQMFTLVRNEAENFTEIYKGVIPQRDYCDMVSELCSGPCIAVEVRAEDCVRELRKHCGPHDVEVAKALRPNTLRGRFGLSRTENAVHCTDLEEDGALESQYFFDILVNTKAN